MSQSCQHMTRNEVKSTFKSLKRKLEFYEREQTRCQKRLKLMESLLSEDERLELDVKLENEKNADPPPSEQLESDEEVVFVLPEESEKDEKETNTAAECTDVSHQNDIEVTGVTQASMTVIDDDLMIVENESVARNETVTSTACEDVSVTYVHLGDSANFPHQRSECVRHKFTAPPSWNESGGPFAENARFCNSCFCYVCDIEVSKCDHWTSGITAHCNAHRRSDFWKKKRKNRSSVANFMNSLEIPEDLNSEKIREFVSEFTDPIKSISDSFITYRDGMEQDHDSRWCDCDCHYRRYSFWDDDYCEECEDNEKQHDFDMVVQACKNVFSSLKTKLTESSDGNGAVTVVYLLTGLLLGEKYTCDPDSLDDYIFPNSFRVESIIKDLAEMWFSVLISGFVSVDYVRKLQSLLRSKLASFIPPDAFTMSIEPLKKILKLLNYAHDLNKILDGTATNSNMIKYPEDLALYVYEKLLQCKKWKKCLNFASIVEVKHEGSLQTFKSTDIVFLNRTKVRTTLPQVAIELGYIDHASELLVLPFTTKLRSGKLHLEDFNKFKESLKKASTSGSSHRSPIDEITSTELTNVINALVQKCKNSQQNKVEYSRKEYLLALKLFVRSVHINKSTRTESYYLSMFKNLCPVTAKYDGITASAKKTIETAALKFVKSGAHSISAMEKQMPSFAYQCEVKISEICMWTTVWASLKYPVTANMPSYYACSRQVEHSSFLTWLLSKNLFLCAVSYYMKLWTLSEEFKKQDEAFKFYVISQLQKALEKCGSSALDETVYIGWMKSKHMEFSNKRSVLELFLEEIKNKKGAEKLLLQKKALRIALALVTTDQKLTQYESNMAFLRDKYYKLSEEVGDKAFAMAFKEKEFSHSPSHSVLMELKKVYSPEVWISKEKVFCQMIKNKIGHPCLLETDEKHADALELFVRRGDWTSVDKLLPCLQSDTHLHHFNSRVFGKVTMSYEWIEYSDKLDKFHSNVSNFISKHLANYLVERNNPRRFYVRSPGQWYNVFYEGGKTYTVPKLMENLIGNISTEKYLDLLHKAVTITISNYNKETVKPDMKTNLITWVLQMRQLYEMVDGIGSFGKTLEFMQISLKRKQAVSRLLKDRYVELTRIDASKKNVIAKPMKVRPRSQIVPPVAEVETGKKNNTPNKKNNNTPNKKKKTPKSSKKKPTSTPPVTPSSSAVTTSITAVKTLSPSVMLSPAVKSSPSVTLSTAEKTSSPAVKTLNPVVKISDLATKTLSPAVTSNLAGKSSPFVMSSPALERSSPALERSSPAVRTNKASVQNSVSVNVTDSPSQHTRSASRSQKAGTPQGPVGTPHTRTGKAKKNSLQPGTQAAVQLVEKQDVARSDAEKKDNSQSGKTSTQVTAVSLKITTGLASLVTDSAAADSITTIPAVSVNVAPSINNGTAKATTVNTSDASTGHFTAGCSTTAESGGKMTTQSGESEARARSALTVSVDQLSAESTVVKEYITLSASGISDKTSDSICTNPVTVTDSSVTSSLSSVSGSVTPISVSRLIVPNTTNVSVNAVSGIASSEIPRKPLTASACPTPGSVTGSSVLNKPSLLPEHTTPVNRTQTSSLLSALTGSMAAPVRLSDAFSSASANSTQPVTGASVSGSNIGSQVQVPLLLPNSVVNDAPTVLYINTPDNKRQKIVISPVTGRINDAATKTMMNTVVLPAQSAGLVNAASNLLLTNDVIKNMGTVKLASPTSIIGSLAPRMNLRPENKTSAGNNPVVNSGNKASASGNPTMTSENTPSLSSVPAGSPQVSAGAGQSTSAVNVAGSRRLPLADVAVSNVLVNITNSAATAAKEKSKQSVSANPATTPASASQGVLNSLLAGSTPLRSILGPARTSSETSQQSASPAATSSNIQTKPSSSVPQYVPVLMNTGKTSLIQLPTGMDFSKLPGAQTQPVQISQSPSEKQEGVIVMLPTEQRHNVLKYLPNPASDKLIALKY